ncbi:hypothetical protein [Nodosilinea sp. FACHB-13]|uniref:hypothetical protein n=1 Tax=Cyanophyceae TaxID=3028117 RepID=UPI0016831135|nr:hypothetical protein [Nodosilinea sp. FACHB-13]
MVADGEIAKSLDTIVVIGCWFPRRAPHFKLNTNLINADALQPEPYGLLKLVVCHLEEAIFF